MRPHDYFTWWLEVFPALIGAVLLIATARRFPLTPLLYVLIRREVVRKRGWLFLIVVAICLAISALYELLEWQVAIASGSKGDAFLGTQGDVLRYVENSETKA